LTSWQVEGKRGDWTCAHAWTGQNGTFSEVVMADVSPDRQRSSQHHHFRFHAPHAHLSRVFGDDWFAIKAEGFARFFGTPTYLVAQTLIVAVWVVVNVAGWTSFDVYPFILLNLAFSLQAAYAAPLILLAQTRQADRDKVHSDADAQHRESLAAAHSERLELAASVSSQILTLLEQNTQLTQVTQDLSMQIKELTAEINRRLAPS
jgi:uncharacterized membrane protein